MIVSTPPALDQWHAIVNQRDIRGLEAMLSANVIFRSPYVWEPYMGREAALRILSMVAEVFQDFQYCREVIEKNQWALEFSARVGEFEIHGIDLIHLDENGQIDEFEIFIRPANGLRALGLEMVRRLR